MGFRKQVAVEVVTWLPPTPCDERLLRRQSVSQSGVPKTQQSTIGRKLISRLVHQTLCPVSGADFD